MINFAYAEKFHLCFKCKLFKMSLRENLLVWEGDAIDKEIEQALFDAEQIEIVDGLKDGLETVYGTKGYIFFRREAQSS